MKPNLCPRDLKRCDSTVFHGAAQEKKSRKQQRQSREGVPTIGIVGYTNAGRSVKCHQIPRKLEDAEAVTFIVGEMVALFPRG